METQVASILGVLIPKAVFYGIFGAFLSELLRWWHVRQSLSTNGMPIWSKHWGYWVITITMVLAGGGLCLAYVETGLTLKPILAVNIGASAPLLISQLAKETPTPLVD